MQITVESREPARIAADLLVLPLFQLDPARWKPPARLAPLERALAGRLGAAISSGDFRGKRGETLLCHADASARARRILLVGLGEETAVDADGLRRAAGTAVATALARRAARVAFLVPATRRVRAPAQAQALAEGATLATYRFDRYKAAREEAPAHVANFSLVFERAADVRPARQAASAGVVLAESQNLARDLSNEPANELPPAALARAAEEMAKACGLRCRVLDVPELRKLEMGGILGVGQGSANPPRLIVLEHNAPAKRARPMARAGRAVQRGGARPTLCIVGKGITFDSGGISIKPAAGMHEMKHDMSGAATVVGTLRAAALLKIPLHVVGVIAAAENMPSGTAYRPGDVLRTASGKTIEILNTDAEGRVVLADALHYARTEFAPDAMVDLATLTGACVVALGKWCSGLFSNDDRLASRLQHAGEAVTERLWHMPLWEAHREAVRGDVADLKNTGGRDGGAITAAAFLSSFVEKTPWAHLDIAGTAYVDKATPYQPRGATGVGVRLLAEWMRSYRSGA
jgi:leucyl aminopeptidase